MRKFIDLTGERSGRLLIMQRIAIPHKKTEYLCLCDCGTEKIILGSSLRSGKTKSCGCIRKELNKINRHLYKNTWKKEEDNILLQYYYEKGSAFCAKLINRTRRSITNRIEKLNLKTIVANSNGLPKKTIIKKISKNRCLSKCKIHGEEMHFCNNNRIKYCLECTRTRAQKPINKFANNLRNCIGKSFKRVRNKNDRHKRMGAFCYLSYTKEELYNYLENTRKLQENKCPSCDISYDKCVMSIDHVIPLIKAKTEQQVIDLFDLKNLNLICKSCNSSKNDTEYNIWKYRLI